jgi:hypothetical protein
MARAQRRDRQGEDRLEISPRTLRFGELAIPLASLRTTSTERTDRLQVATASEMWQFRLREGSVFRLQRATARWRGAPGFERCNVARRVRTEAPSDAPVEA